MARTRHKIKQETHDETQTQVHTQNTPVQATLPQRHISIASSIDEPRTQSSSATLMNEDTEMIDHDRNRTNGLNGHRDTHGQPVDSNEDGAMQALGHNSRQLITAIQKLQALGIEATLSLPKFVVVGDQSHGKSSVIEAICDISLPRSEGTCTRCPFRITTTACDKPWSCKVSLLRSYEYDPSRPTTSPYAGWHDTDTPNPEEFCTVPDKSMLEHALRLAQVAMLNPDISPKEVFETNDPSMSNNNSISFSPNVIALDIAGSNLPELSLYDLPGAICMAREAREKHMPDFIKDLLKSYLQDDKALVLLAVAASADTEISSAFKYVEDCGAMDRCVGVLTKPDLMSTSRERVKQTERMLGVGDKFFELGYGWFVTKQRSQDELDSNMSWEQARELEKKFFNTQQPWATSLVRFADRFGIAHLQETISIELTRHILSELPKITALVKERLSQVEDDLSNFPKQTFPSFVTVMKELNALHDMIADEVQGKKLSNKFIDSYKTIFRKLRQRLTSARPTLNMKTPGFKPPAIPIDDEDEETEEAPTPSKKAKLNNGRANGVAGRGRGETPHTPRLKTEDPTSRSVPANLPLALTLDGLKHKYDLGLPSGLPGVVNFKITESLIQECRAGWPTLVNQALDQVSTLCTKMIGDSVSKSLQTRKGTKLFDAAKQVVNSLFMELMSQQRDLVQHLVKCELHAGITYNEDAHDHAKAALEKKLITLRNEARANEHFDTEEGKGMKVTTPEDRKKKMSEHDFVRSKLGSDRYNWVISEMAMVLAYYDYSLGSLVDTMAKTLECGLLSELEGQLTDKLMVELRAGEPEHCALLLAEDPRRELQRARLDQEKRKLVAALEELNALHVGV